MYENHLERLTKPPACLTDRLGVRGISSRFGDKRPESAKVDRAVDGFCWAKPPLPLTQLTICKEPPRNVSCLSWKWRKRSSVKIMERTHEERAQALHC